MSLKARGSALGLALLVLGSVSLSLQYTAHRHRNKNWCAFIVQKNVSCAVRAHPPALIEAEAAPCPPHQPDCEPSLTYQTHFQPIYRISYKTVTELEWRCCPGYQGPDCKELKSPLNRQIMFQPQPHPQSHPGHTQNTQRSEQREKEQHNGHHDDVEKTRQLEEEMQRLSQTVLDLQAAMTSLTANMRTDLQEDTSKILVTLLNNMHLPDSVRSGGTEESTVHLDGHQATRGLSHEEKGMEEVLARLTDVTDALKSKDEAIDELRNTVTGHDGQIRMLLDASLGSEITASASDIDILQTYIDTKFDKLKKELVVDMKDQIAKLKTECDDRILSLQKTCKESQERSYENLTKLVERKEADLRNEIRELRLDMAMSDGVVRTHRQTTPIKDDDDLHKTLQRVLEAYQVLNVRMDNELKHLSMLKLEDVFGPRLEELEAQMNVTERNAETYCFYVDEKVTKDLADEITKIRQLLEDRLSSMEDQFTAMLIEMSNSSFPDTFSDSLDVLQTQVKTNKDSIQGLEDKLTTIGQMCSNDCKSSLSIDTQNLGGLESITRDLRNYRNDMDVLNTGVENNAAKLIELEGITDRLLLKNEQNSDNIQNVHTKLNLLADNVSDLSGAVTGLGDAMSRFSQDLETLNSSCCLIGQQELVQRQPETIPSLPHRDTPSLSQMEELKNRLESLNNQVTAQLGICKENATAVAESISSVDNRVATLEKLRGKLGDNRNQDMQDMKESLERDLETMNSTLQTQFKEINNLQKNLLNLSTQLATLKTNTTNQPGLPVKQENAPDTRTSTPPRKTYTQQLHIPLIIPQRSIQHPPVRQPHVHSPNQRQPYAPLRPTNPRQPHSPLHPTNPRQPHSPLHPTNPRQPHSPLHPTNPRLQPNRPVLMSGEAGPPGYTSRGTTRRDHASYISQKPINGFAGSPGYPVNPVSYKSNPIAVSQLPWNPTQKLFTTQVASERNSVVEPFSFSAGLTEQTFSGDFGIIRFNRVLVNDGGHYNPDSGVFTVPVNGRYLVSAVLTAPRRERVEAVLSVSERSVQRLDSAANGGYDGQHASRPCQCGSSVTCNLVLSLRAGDRVALVRTAGTLAVSEAREILSTFSAVFLYSPQSHR